MPALSGVKVEGLRELQRALKVADKDLAKDLRKRLRDAGEPVRAEAERLAASSIRNMTTPWSRMRVGSTTSYVYVAPRKRGTKRPGLGRTNLAQLLMDRAMDPALERRSDDVAAELDRMLGDISERWGTGG